VRELLKELAILVLLQTLVERAEALIMRQELQRTKIVTFAQQTAEALLIAVQLPIRGVALIEHQRLFHVLIVERTQVSLELTPTFVVAAKETIAFSKGLKELHHEIITPLGRIPTLALIILMAELAEVVTQAIGLTRLAVHLIVAHPLALAQAEAADRVTAEAQVALVAQVAEAAEAVLVAQVEVVLVEDDN